MSTRSSCAPTPIAVRAGELAGGARGAIGLGWSTGAGRPLERPLFGIALAGGDGTSWYLPWDRRSAAARLVRARRSPAARPRPEAAHGHARLAGSDAGRLHRFDTLVAGYMVNPALRSQTLDDVASTRFGGELPPKPLTPETGAEEAACAGARRVRRLTALLVRPRLETELAEGGLASLFTEVEMPLVGVLARMELAGVLIDLGALAQMRDEFADHLEGLEARIYELGRARVQHRLTEAARADPLPRARPDSNEAHAHRLFDRCIGAGGAARQARGHRSHPRASAGRQAQVDVRRRAPDAGGCRGSAAHDLPAGGGGHRAPVEHRSEPPEHPDPHGARPAHPARLRRPRGQARCSGPTTRSRSCGSSPTCRAIPGSRPTSRPTRISTSPPRPACLGHSRPEQVGPRADDREDDQLRHCRTG